MDENELAELLEDGAQNGTVPEHQPVKEGVINHMMNHLMHPMNQMMMLLKTMRNMTRTMKTVIVMMLFWKPTIQTMRTVQDFVDQHKQEYQILNTNIFIPISLKLKNIQKKQQIINYCYGYVSHG